MGPSRGGFSDAGREASEPATLARGQGGRLDRDHGARDPVGARVPRRGVAGGPGDRGRGRRRARLGAQFRDSVPHARRPRGRGGVMRAQLRPLLVTLGFALGATACATLAEAPTAADRVVEYVAELCTVPSAERGPLLAELNAVTAPARVSVDCAR
ncbi:MAG: hypothetical protein E6R03_06350 [Hyphomicrobiaceae bacterium]|nr:MAG: hypothetical protein E6R03_06350 [Hyphomicrobiaceae bacterium]